MSMTAGELARLDRIEQQMVAALAEIRTLKSTLEVTSAPVEPPKAANDDASFAF